MYKIVCSECECLYESKFSTTKFCGDKCRSKYNRRNKGHKRSCFVCNQTFNSYKPKKYCSDICKEQSFQRRKKERLEQTEQLEKGKAIRKLLQILSNISSRARVCTLCDKEFVLLKGVTGNKYCSQECKDKGYKINRNKNRNKHRVNKDKRWAKNGKADYSISLKALHERDEGVCHLCSKETDYSDYELTEEGYFIAGNNYPSIDHVVPLANGGLHQWNNVKLAHRYCNSIKSDNEVEFQIFFGI